MRFQRAEGVGFEPTEPFGSPVFKTGAIDHSTTPPMSSGAIETLKRKRAHNLEAVKETIRGVIRWKIRGLYRGGKRVRKFFPTEKKALEFIGDELAKARNLGEQARNIPGHLHEDALRAFDLLQDFGVTLEEMAKFYIAAIDRRQKSQPMRRVIAEYCENLKCNLRSVRHLDDLKSRLGRFEEDFGDTLASEIARRDIDQWLAKLKPSGKGSAKYSPLSIVNFHRVVRGLFTYAVKMGYVEKRRKARSAGLCRYSRTCVSSCCPTLIVRDWCCRSLAAKLTI